ncbi:hypothetical protein [Glutamicibacter halophytocola]|uniref:hypothetical protein n=1 Tax=Glutamicibacter halophytocola TaxID=1933880 RepID=UPI001892CA5B|nr:hypothetical protein [Glutamicibacter halophytocola]
MENPVPGIPYEIPGTGQGSGWDARRLAFVLFFAVGIFKAERDGRALGVVRIRGSSILALWIRGLA